MLKNIPVNLAPELVKIMMEMGHGDQIVLGDGNFPASSHHHQVIRADGLGVVELLESILTLMPLDSYAEHQVKLMAVLPGDDFQPVIWEAYEEVLNRHYDNCQIDYLERFSFYEEAKKSYGIVATSEKSLYANVILKKGVL